MRKWHTAIAALGLAGLSACGGSKQPAGEATSEAPVETAATVAANEPPTVFMQCVACHSVKPGVNGVGPSLVGRAGGKAAGVAGYAYSDALKASGLTWDDATLDKWLTSPVQTVPGTKMVFPGVPDPAKRKDVIAYLKTLK